MNSPYDKKADAVEFHSDIASDFHASYQFDANRLERVAVWNEFLNRYAKNAKFAYDIGCGSGVLSCDLASRGIEVVGIDGAPGMLEIANQTAKNKNLSNVSFQQHRLPISNTSSFRAADIVISSSVIEYLEAIPESLVFLRNLLTQDGIVIFSVSNSDSVSRKIVRLIYRLTGKPKYFGLLRHFMTIEDICKDLLTAELSYVEHTYFGRADRLNQVLSIFLAPKFSSNMILVVARKQR